MNLFNSLYYWLPLAKLLGLFPFLTKNDTIFFSKRILTLNIFWNILIFSWFIIYIILKKSQKSIFHPDSLFRILNYFLILTVIFINLFVILYRNVLIQLFNELNDLLLSKRSYLFIRRFLCPLDLTFIIYIFYSLLFFRRIYLIIRYIFLYICNFHIHLAITIYISILLLMKCEFRRINKKLDNISLERNNRLVQIKKINALQQRHLKLFQITGKINSYLSLNLLFILAIFVFNMIINYNLFIFQNEKYDWIFLVEVNILTLILTFKILCIITIADSTSSEVSVKYFCCLK